MTPPLLPSRRKGLLQGPRRKVNDVNPLRKRQSAVPIPAAVNNQPFKCWWSIYARERVEVVRAFGEKIQLD